MAECENAANLIYSSSSKPPVQKHIRDLERDPDAWLDAGDNTPLVKDHPRKCLGWSTLIEITDTAFSAGSLLK
jgi:hypothetical protein